MKEIVVERWDAFTQEPWHGNPGGLIFDAGALSDDEMLQIARLAGFSECAFILPSRRADWRIRYFMPNRETLLCGHCTVCAIAALENKGHISGSGDHTIETGAGILPVSYDRTKETVTMRQADARFDSFDGSVSRLAELIGIGEEEVDRDLPIVYGNTGVWTLLIPIRSEAPFGKMSPRTSEFASLLEKHPEASLHPFCMVDKSCKTLYCRHFSGSFSGTTEDAVTGTAAGALSAYALKHIFTNESGIETIIKQGHEMDVDGVVEGHVKRQDDAILVSISGRAVKSGEMVLHLDDR